MVYHAKWLDYLLIGWGSFSFVFTAWTWLIIWRFNSADTEKHASKVEPDSEFVRWFIAGAAVLSLAAVGRMLLETSDRHGPAPLAVVSIAISWFAIHTIYALTYAKCYYKRHPGGIDFNRKKEEPRYIDFAYLACTIGMSFAVSDTNLTTWEMRRTALGHSLLSISFRDGHHRLDREPARRLVIPPPSSRRIRPWLVHHRKSAVKHALTRSVYTQCIRSIYPLKGALVPKRLIDLDNDLLAAAQRELSTTGVSDTVRTALQQVAAKSARARQVEWLEQGGLESMADPDERGEVWR